MSLENIIKIYYISVFVGRADHSIKPSEYRAKPIWSDHNQSLIPPVPLCLSALYCCTFSLLFDEVHRYSACNPETGEIGFKRFRPLYVAKCLSIN